MSVMTRAVPGLLLLITPLLCQTRGGLADYALLLEDPPVAQRSHSRAELRGPEALAWRQHLRGAQNPVLAELARRKVRVTSTSQVLLNAVFVRTTREQAGDLLGIPGVARVAYLPPIHRNLDLAAGLVNASAAWSALGGAAGAGAGVRIAIVDTGIDQNHDGFHDPSLRVPDGFPKGDANYTNNKVIVAKSYVSLLSDTNPLYSFPDDTTPRDRVGHGTAIAMIAAGVSNKGPASGTIQGIAPKAFLGNYKIFGSPGVNDYTQYPALVQALEDALNDGMDIVVLALGEGDPALYSASNQPPDCLGNASDFCDPRPQLVENMIKQGLTVVVAAGNDGNTGIYTPSLGTIHTPGIAPSAITVGATANAHRFAAAVHVTGGDDYDAGFSDGPKAVAPIKGRLKDAATLQNDGLACTALPAGSLAGAIALIQRGTCTFSDKINNARDAGAAGVILYQASGSDLTLMGARDTGIPAVMIGNAGGLALKSLAAAQSVEVTLDPALHAISTRQDQNTVAPFSSRGPAPTTYGIKPELVAPGVGIYSATQKLDPNGDLYNPSGYAGAGGTSYAAAMVAGGAALVIQKNPRFTPAQVKSALVNTATSGDVSDESGAPARITSAGAGKLNLADAVKTALTVQPATLSFGVITSIALPSQQLLITNSGSNILNLTLAVHQRDGDPKAQVQLSPSSLTIAPGGAQRTVTVSLTGSRPNPGEYEGFIDITVSGGNPTLHVPYMYLVSDRNPYNFLPLQDVFFTSMVSDPGWWPLSFRITDRYGIPVLGTQVNWSVVSGGGKIQSADPQTQAFGNAGAHVLVGPQLGDQVFRAAAAGVNYDFTATGEPQPAIRDSQGVLNIDGSAGPFAPGSYVAIYGAGLAAGTSLESTLSLPVSLATTSVSFDGGGISLPGHIHFVSPGQINVQIPWEFQGQSSVEMKVSTPYATTAYVSGATNTVPLGTYSPAIFYYSDGGTVIAAAVDIDAANPASSYVVSQANGAKRGDFLVLFVNGLGPVSDQPASGEPSPGSEPGEALATTNATPVVTIGGVPVHVDFSGMTPGSLGLYQVNVKIPSEVPGGLQPVMVSIGGVDSRIANLPVQ
jgi:minor extracellular serine protease Vpr